jgi:hypothetical protein
MEHVEKKAVKTRRLAKQGRGVPEPLDFWNAPDRLVCVAAPVGGMRDGSRVSTNSSSFEFPFDVTARHEGRRLSRTRDSMGNVVDLEAIGVM